MGSLECTHWEWHQCQTGMAGAYQSWKGSRGVVVEAVCDEDLRIEHLFLGAFESLNDINVLNQSPLYVGVTAGRWPPQGVTFSVNGITRTLRYYLVDGIYPRYAFLVSPHPMPMTEEAKTFNRLQEAIRKEVERLFSVRTKRFHIALHPGRYRSMKQMITTYKTVRTLHNMCVESCRDGLLSRRRGAAGTNNGEGAGSEGEGPAGADAAAAGAHDGKDGGGDDGGAAAAWGPAPSGGGAAGPADAVGAANPPPALNAVVQPPTGCMVAVLDALGETRNPTEHEELRADLTAHVWSDHVELLAASVV